MEGLVKNLKIKTGTLKRLTKEKTMYEQEVVALQEKILKYKDEGRDEYFMKKQNEVLKEANMMVPDTIRRLKKAYYDLESAINAVSNNAEIKDSEYLQNAVTMLKEAEPHIQ